MSELINDKILDIETQIDNKLEDLAFRIWEKYNEWDYSFKVEENEKWEKEYKAVLMWVIFPWVDTPEEMMNILKNIQKLNKVILDIYKKEWYNEEFYAWKWLWNALDKKTSVWDRSDLYIDNMPTDFLDRVILTNEWLQWLLDSKSNDFTNKFMEKYAEFLNIYTKKIINKKEQK